MIRIITSCKRVVPIVIAFACFGSDVIAGSAESIQVKENEQTFEISVPVSKLVLFLPKGNFKRSVPAHREGSIANPRYFQFLDPTTGVRISGWFEHASRFKGVTEPDPASVKGIPLIYENMSFSKIGVWDSVSYDVLFQDDDNPNIKSSLVFDNTWIELHISGKQRDLIRDIIQSTWVKVKS